MEDAAIHNPNIGDGNALFAVFDGHGGTSFNTKASRLVAMLLMSSQNNSCLVSPTKMVNSKKLSTKLLKE